MGMLCTAAGAASNRRYSGVVLGRCWAFSQVLIILKQIPQRYHLGDHFRHAGIYVWVTSGCIRWACCALLWALQVAERYSGVDLGRGWAYLQVLVILIKLPQIYLLAKLGDYACMHADMGHIGLNPIGMLRTAAGAASNRRYSGVVLGRC